MIKSEIETTITYNMEDSFATVYTCMPAVMRRIESKGITAEQEYRSDGKVIAKQYTVPKKWIRISPLRRVGEEQRKAAAIRLHQMREIAATSSTVLGEKPLEMDCGGMADE